MESRVSVATTTGADLYPDSLRREERSFPPPTVNGPFTTLMDDSMPHAPTCKTANGEWSGSPNPNTPDEEWICDECGRIIKSEWLLQGLKSQREEANAVQE